MDDMTDVLPDELPESGLAGAGLVALVTGATSGIGREVARRLVQRGLSVWVGARDVERGRSAADELGPRARVVALDVTVPESVAAAAAAVGDLDVLVNNAGVNPGGQDVTATGWDQLRTAYETNVFGLVAVTRAFWPALERSEHPRVVNVSSGTGSLTWATAPNPQFDGARMSGGGLAYRSSKTAVNAVTVLTAQALGARGRVNALAPGLRRTRLVPGMDVGGDPGEAAAGAVRLALLPDDGPTGALWSWDGTRVPW